MLEISVIPRIPVLCHTQLRATCLEERHVHKLSNPVHHQPTECIPQTCRKGGVNLIYDMYRQTLVAGT